VWARWSWLSTTRRSCRLAGLVLRGSGHERRGLIDEGLSNSRCPPPRTRRVRTRRAAARRTHAARRRPHAQPSRPTRDPAPHREPSVRPRHREVMARVIRGQPLKRAHERVVDVLFVDGHIPLPEQFQRALEIGARDRVQPLDRPMAELAVRRVSGEALAPQPAARASRSSSNSSSSPSRSGSSAGRHARHTTAGGSKNAMSSAHMTTA
jgi:hypothetical protein